MKKNLLLIVLAGLMVLAACKKDKENQGVAQFTATTEQQGGSAKTSLDPNNGQINWTSGDQIVIGNDNGETAVFSLQSGEGTTEGSFGTSNEFNTVGPFIAAYPSDAVIENDVVTFNLPATQTIGETGTFANGANPMVACSDDKNLQFKNLCGGLGIRLKGVGAHVSAVRITSKNTEEKLWGAYEVSNCAAAEPTLTVASGNQSSNIITLNCDVTLTTAAKTFFVMLPPGTLANGFTMEVLDGNEVLATKETTSDIALVERNEVKVFNEILIDMEFDGNVEIPTGMSNSDIVVTNFSEDAIPDENGDFAIGYSKMLVAKNADNGKVMYYSLYSIESGSKTATENDYEVGARETALFFAIRLFPFYLKDGYDDVLLKVKESLYTLPCVTQLESTIRNTVATYGYLKEDEIAPAVHNVSDFFYNEFMSVQASIPETKDEPAPTKLDPPYFSPNHRHGVRLNINETHFLEDPQRWSINCTGYSSQFSALGIVEGYLNENNFFSREGSTPYYMPPMGMSQYAKLAENVAFMTMPGNWAGLLQLYRKVKQAINDPDYLLELTHVTYENMTFELPRTANAIGVLTPLDDETVAVRTAIYMAYDLFSLIPTFGAYPIESIINAYLQDGDFVNLVRTQRHNGEEGWSMIVEAMYDRIDEITQAIAPDIPLDIINSLTPIGTVCSGLDLFLATITWGTLSTFALPVVTDFPTTELPVVAITNVENVTGTTAQVNGRVVSTGSHSILERGVCYSTSHNPTFEGGHVEATLPTTDFSCSLEDLQPNTLYYVRAYAINELGYIGYSSNEISFNTVNVPNVTTLDVTNIATASATANGHVTYSDMSQIIERGFLYDTSPDGLFYGSAVCDGVVYEGPLQNDFSCSMTGLYPYTEYYVRAYAKTSEGIGYGEKVSFTTHTEVPLITTYSVNETDITSTSAVFHGKVEGLASNLVMTRGFMYNTSPYVNISQPDVTIVDAPEGGTGEFTVTATGLTPNTTYYYLAYIWMSYPGTNEVEIFHGPELSFTTLSGGESFIVSVSANPTNGGTVTGGDTYNQGQSCTVTATANSGYTFSNWTENGNAVSTDASYTFTVSGNRTLVANFTANGGSGGGDEHAYVDLGLPSGLLWATCNVGANAPEDYGDYFAWGETQPKYYYDWSTYQYCNGSYNTLTKYCNDSSYGYNGFTDNLITLEPSDDAATANWGNGWRMPTQAEFQELRDNTTVTWTTQNGVNGCLFTAANGNSLFLPADGYRYDSSLYDAGRVGYYWSSSLYTGLHAGGPINACVLYFGSGHCDMTNYRRIFGQSVRPVRSARQN